MGYYKDRKKAQKIVRDMILENKTVDQIKMKIVNNFGFSEKFVESYMELISRVNKNEKK